jgi:hypothetical protein
VKSLTDIRDRATKLLAEVAAAVQSGVTQERRRGRPVGSKVSQNGTTGSESQHRGSELQQRVKFAEIWLVGYTVETTVRIHPARGTTGILTAQSDTQTAGQGRFWTKAAQRPGSTRTASCSTVISPAMP